MIGIAVGPPSTDAMGHRTNMFGDQISPVGRVDRITLWLARGHYFGTLEISSTSQGIMTGPKTTGSGQIPACRPRCRRSESFLSRLFLQMPSRSEASEMASQLR